MNTFKLISVYDRVNGVYSAPRLFTDNLPSTFRTVQYVLSLGNDPDFCTFVDDKELFELGEIDLQTGDISPAKKFIIKLKELKSDDRSNDKTDRSPSEVR